MTARPLPAARSADAPTVVRSVYVHAPFCARRCVYCDFAVKVRAGGGGRDWLEALGRELEHVRREGLFALDERLATLYVGGGTPSLLEADAMAGLAELLGPGRLRAAELEWTVEANPESFDAEVAAAWRRAGVNRVSLGVQTFDERALRWMGRLHGTRGGPEAVARARTAGIENVSIDLIFALPAHLGRSWEDDLARALELDVPHVSLYGLGVEPATALGRAVAAGREPAVDEERYAEEFLLAARTLTAAGYEHYEVSNFAKSGRRARHNAVYWNGAPYLGLGNGAHSYAPPIRRWNVRDWDEYAARSGETPEADREVLDGAALDLERVWLSLRTSEGLDQPAPGTPQALLVEKWVRRGHATCAGGRVRLTPEGWLLLDRLAVDYAG